MKKKEALLKIPVSVSTHATNETDDKAEVVTVTMKSIDGLFYIAMGEAKAQLKIQVKDDIIKHNFPLSREYILEIYPREISEPQPQIPTEPTTLEEHITEDDNLEESTTEALETLEEEKSESEEPEEE